MSNETEERNREMIDETNEDTMAVDVVDEYEHLASDIDPDQLLAEEEAIREQREKEDQERLDRKAQAARTLRENASTMRKQADTQFKVACGIADDLEAQADKLDPCLPEVTPPCAGGAPPPKKRRARKAAASKAQSKPAARKPARSTRGSAKPRKSAARRSGGKANGAQKRPPGAPKGPPPSEAEVLTALKKTPGISRRELCTMNGWGYSGTGKVLDDLVKEWKVHSTGDRRSCKWHPGKAK